MTGLRMDSRWPRVGGFVGGGAFGHVGADAGVLDVQVFDDLVQLDPFDGLEGDGWSERDVDDEIASNDLGRFQSL